MQVFLSALCWLKKKNPGWEVFTTVSLHNGNRIRRVVYSCSPLRCCNGKCDMTLTDARCWLHVSIFCVCHLPQGTIASSLTCVQLHKRAEKIAAMLAERGHLQDGDHVALVYPPGKHWQQVSLLYLCLCGDTAGCHRFTEIPQIFKIKADLNQEKKKLGKVSWLILMYYMDRCTWIRSHTQTQLLLHNGSNMSPDPLWRIYWVNEQIDADRLRKRF